LAGPSATGFLRVGDPASPRLATLSLGASVQFLSYLIPY
jgi:hypothetical protein